MAASLPDGVVRAPIEVFGDDRGRFAEIFRETWPTGVQPVQWNVLQSAKHTLRGVHVHVRHDDYLVQVSGRCEVALRDLRAGSPTESCAVVVELDGTRLDALVIPHGVAHGLYHPEDSLQVLGVSHYYDKVDEQGCRWDDPALGLEWSPTDPVLSERDHTLPPLASLLESISPWQPMR